MLQEKMDRIEATFKALSRANDNHIAQLGNFAKHDIKNAIQSMDSIFQTTEYHEYDEITVTSLIAHLSLIRTVMDNFAKVIPHSPDGKFILRDLLVAVELLNRSDMATKQIEITYDYDRGSDEKIEMPFQDTIMIINNLLVNSMAALQATAEKRIRVKGEIHNGDFSIKVLDNGLNIPQENESKIFEFGFSTTNGSGVGLYHAQFLCEKFKGNICLINDVEDIYTKSFLITLPLSKNDAEEHSNN